MNRFSRCNTLGGLLLVSVVVLLLAACGPAVKTNQDVSADSFDLTLQAYKSGQFLLNGAILSSLDLSSHFAYLRDQKDLPKTVLLKRSDDSKIKKQHLQYMASMAYTYGFTVVYDKGGELRRIVPDVGNKMKLRESPKSDEKKGNPHVDSKNAAHDGTGRDRSRGY